MRNIRVLTLNIRACVGNDLRHDIDRVAALTAAANADLAALQEVDRRTSRSEGADQAACIARAAQMREFFIPSFEFQGGLFGNAILSRLETDRFETLQYQRRSDEPRSAGALRVRTRPDAPWFWFVTTHLGLDSDGDEPLAQCRELTDWLAETTGREEIILTGDLNEEPHQNAPKQLVSRWTDLWATLGEGPGHTWPSDEPQRRIDYVFHAPRRESSLLQPTTIELLDTDATDHRGVLATFTAH